MSTVKDNDLIKIARQTWNQKLLVPVTPTLLKARPLMVFGQQVLRNDQYEESPSSYPAQFVKKEVAKLIAESAPFTHAIESDYCAAALCLAANACEYSIWDLSGKKEDAASSGIVTNIDQVYANFRDNIGKDDSLYICLYSLFVLPDADAQSIELSEVEDTIAGMTGFAWFFDPSDGMTKLQKWNEGEQDTGYLWAIQNDNDTDDYCSDSAPMRKLLSILVTQMS